MQEIPNNYTENVGEEWEPQDSILLKKIIDMMLYAYIVLRNFPKSERYAIVADIKRCMDEMMELVIEADNKHYKKSTLHDLDTVNKKLKKYILLTFKLKFLAMKQYENWTEKVTEIGRIIGGRIAAEEAKEARETRSKQRNYR
ncbi:MAG: diversity-generating retroelement protein Avd [Lachnospiraceae bacterium]|nr:diversity-generating retroelement protein Avd [Lachnospiraceae bacterium]